ncbi:unnamed protein product [Medioppia subpectinata]|uniref:Uncharacterized protein n=1 Tax=Medioppia subpectinata TaxID=1979941 RepID=A0A7R9KU52_9ACAR|nr:unnamed protein product [Medioppia subpectinata]CAG2109928.1 unnamed protein product [Medioppia subpectinata]
MAAKANENTYILQETQQISTINSNNNPGDDDTASQSTATPADTKQLVYEPNCNRLGPTSNLHQTGFNYVNSIIGSGVIGIPYALRTGGFGFGVVLIVLIAVITDYSLCILVKAGNIVGVNTYQTTQAIAVPQAGGGVSIVQLLPNQPNVVQSVIQPNQQSVIQATGGAQTVQTVQLPKGNVILLKGGQQVGQGSVIHSTDTDTGIHHGVQILSKGDDGSETLTPVIFEDESRKRREILARRPSYRKILNDLSSTEGQSVVTAIPAEIKQEDDERDGTTTIQVGGQYLKVLPASAIQLGSQDGTLQGIQTLTMTNANAGSQGTIVQYATQGQDGQFYVPVTVSAADLQAYQIRAPSQTSITQGVVMTSTGGLQGGQVVPEEASKKRELRLLKNREAAKECRRKKKEYIKCLENRVAVLENQNKALIEELKSLKELYCQKAD